MNAGERRRAAGDEGSIALELAVIFPVLLTFLCLVVGAGWIVGSRSDVAGAAQAGARAAATARFPGDMNQLATQAANAALSGSDTCSNPQVSVGGALVPGGEVSVTVTCVVDLGKLATFGLFGSSRTVSATAEATVDQYRVVAG
jgi:Flp pilus assembly protein TadG